MISLLAQIKTMVHYILFQTDLKNHTVKDKIMYLQQQALDCADPSKQLLHEEHLKISC